MLLFEIVSRRAAAGASRIPRCSEVFLTACHRKVFVFGTASCLACPIIAAIDTAYLAPDFRGNLRGSHTGMSIVRPRARMGTSITDSGPRLKPPTDIR